MPIGEELTIPFIVGADAAGTLAERLIARMAPWNTGPVRNGSTDLERYLRAAAAIAQPVDELTREEGSDGEPGHIPAWGKLLDPLATPFATNPSKELQRLAYIGQYVGVPIPAGASVAEARELVKAHNGFSRGTPEALKQTVERVLGTNHFQLEERTGPLGEENAYWFVLVVPTGKATQALYNAINAVKPAGIWYTIVEATDAWLSGSKTWAAIAPGLKWTELAEGTF